MSKRICETCGQETASWFVRSGKHYCQDKPECAPGQAAAPRVATESSTPVVEEAADFGGAIERMAARARETEAALNQAAAGVPQTRLCERHKFARRISFDESRRRTVASGAPTIVYEPCKDCEAEARAARESDWLRRCGVPDNLVGSSFGTFRAREAEDKANLERARAFAAKKRGFLVMFGDVGTGKSTLAAAVMRSMGGGWFTTQAAFVSAMRRRYDDHKAPDAKEKAKSTRLLVMDELGLSSEGSDVFPAIHEVLDHRHGAKLPTVLVANFCGDDAAGEFKKYVGERLADRLRQSTFSVLVFAGESMRAESRKEYFL
jgi:DNA replication protein DnaC